MMYFSLLLKQIITTKCKNVDLKMYTCELIEKYCRFCNKMYKCTIEDKERCIERRYKRDLKLATLIEE